ncbi:hypothetical protein [Mimivirus argentum]|uniref:Uncharacterized protein n=1 Tax=Mimivirus sp. 'lentille' TaxID=1128146 RepID=H6WBD3_9VIRU|nr:hypothetical protein tv_R1 [Mimivirus lentille]AEY99253.1 hypothetical protein tv_R1 [Acanthamoeba castellanii mamavirus]UMZ08533.1 hypothetical protein [Mimivirus argentum]
MSDISLNLNAKLLSYLATLIHNEQNIISKYHMMYEYLDAVNEFESAIRENQEVKSYIQELKQSLDKLTPDDNIVQIVFVTEGAGVNNQDGDIEKNKHEFKKQVTFSDKNDDIFIPPIKQSSQRGGKLNKSDKLRQKLNILGGDAVKSIGKDLGIKPEKGKKVLTKKYTIDKIMSNIKLQNDAWKQVNNISYVNYTDTASDY